MKALSAIAALHHQSIETHSQYLAARQGNGCNRALALQRQTTEVLTVCRTVQQRAALATHQQAPAIAATRGVVHVGDVTAIIRKNRPQPAVPLSRKVTVRL